MRQLALLHFRNIITLSIKLDNALSRPGACVPPSIIQMLLILQVNIFTSHPYIPQQCVCMCIEDGNVFLENCKLDIQIPAY